MTLLHMILFFGCGGMFGNRILESKRTHMAEIVFLPSSAGCRASPNWRVTRHAPWDADGHQRSDGETVMVSILGFQVGRQYGDEMVFKYHLDVFKYHITWIISLTTHHLNSSSLMSPSSIDSSISWMS